MGSTTFGVLKQSDTLPRKAPCGYQMYHLLHLVPTDTATVTLEHESDNFCHKIKESMVDGTGYLLDNNGLLGITLN
jgi:hypothetical protein